MEILPTEIQEILTIKMLGTPRFVFGEGIDINQSYIRWEYEGKYYYEIITPKKDI